MHTMFRSRMSSFGIVAVLVGTLVAPMAAAAEGEVLAMAPAAPSWDDASGYGSVEASRAAIGAATSWEGTSGYRSVEATRVLIAERALLAGDLGSMQEQRLAELVTASTAGAPIDSYDSVEASRAGASGLMVSPSAS